ncbi:MAG: M16 family metallopeptidase [Pyrobaculum sp.]
MKNGVVLYVDRFPSHLASVAVLVGVGPLYEEKERRGATHLLEHMLFHIPNFDIDAAVETLGGEANAFTYRDALVIIIETLAESARGAVELAYRIYTNSNFHVGDLEKEKAIVLSELRQSREDPAERVAELAVGALFGDSDWGAPVGGRPEAIEAIELEDLLSHKERWFTPDNTIVALSGGVDEGAIKTAVELFGKLEGVAPGKKKPTASRGPPRVVERRDVDGVYYAYAAEVQTDRPVDTYIQLAAASFHLGDGAKSILFQLLRNRGISYSYHVEFDVVGDTAYILTAVESATGLQEAREAVLEALRPREPPQYRLTFFKYLWSRRSPSTRALEAAEFLNKGGDPAQLDASMWRAVQEGTLWLMPKIRRSVEAIIAPEKLI